MVVVLVCVGIVVVVCVVLVVIVGVVVVGVALVVVVMVVAVAVLVVAVVRSGWPSYNAVIRGHGSSPLMLSQTEPHAVSSEVGGCLGCGSAEM
jgi:hypothetical protein